MIWHAYEVDIFNRDGELGLGVLLKDLWSGVAACGEPSRSLVMALCTSGQAFDRIACEECKDQIVTTETVLEEMESVV